MTKHAPDFSYLRGLKPLAFSVDECLKIAEYRSKILRPETKLSEPIIILADAVKAKDTRIAELEAELAAEKSSHQHTAMCFDQAWDKIIWLREALKRQFCRANAEREKVERLSDIIADLIAGGESAEQADPRLGYIELQTDRETLARAREALAALDRIAGVLR